MSARKGVNPRRETDFSLERQCSMKSLPLLIPLLLKAARQFVRDAGYTLSRMLFALMARNGLILGVFYVPEGSKFFFSETLATAKGITALTNANPAVATSVAHGFVDNDEVLLNLGWEDANGVWRVDQLTADSFSVLGLDSTDTDFYAAGGGTGTAQKISGWTEIPQVLSINTTGGDPRYTPVQPLSRRNAIQMATGFNPSSVELTLGWDPALAAYQAMQNISRRLAKVALKMTLSGGAVAYAYGTLAVSEIPQLQSGQVDTVRAAMSVDGRLISYAV